MAVPGIVPITSEWLLTTMHLGPAQMQTTVVLGRPDMGICMRCIPIRWDRGLETMPTTQTSEGMALFQHGIPAFWASGHLG